MLFSAAQRLLLAQLFAACVVAHRDWWLKGLPACWQECLSSTEDGCSSTECICKTTVNSASYLPSAVACAVSQCEADYWPLILALDPLQLYCFTIDYAIPDEVMTNAYAAASGMQETTPTSHVVSPTTRSKSAVQTTTKASDDGSELKSTVGTTIVRTTTDGAGNTLQVIVPIVMGPSGISTGATVTSTLGDKGTSAQATVSASASPSMIAGESSAAATQTASISSSLGSPQDTNPASGNGSPFENMQAAASRWSFSPPLLALGALVILFARL